MVRADVAVTSETNAAVRKVATEAVSNLAAVPSTSIDPNMGRINGSPGDFGRIVSTSNNPRLIQFAIKFSF